MTVFRVDDLLVRRPALRQVYWFALVGEVNVQIELVETRVDPDWATGLPQFTNRQDGRTQPERNTLHDILTCSPRTPPLVKELLDLRQGVLGVGIDRHRHALFLAEPEQEVQQQRDDGAEHQRRAHDRLQSY